MMNKILKTHNEQMMNTYENIENVKNDDRIIETTTHENLWKLENIENTEKVVKKRKIWKMKK